MTSPRSSSGRVLVALALAAAALVACRGQRTPGPPPRPRTDNIDVFLAGGATELQPYLDGYPLGDMGTRTDLLAYTSTRSMHLVQAAKPIARHYHPARTETVYVLTGTGRMYLGDKAYPVAPGATFKVSPGAAHGVFPSEGSTIVAVAYFEPPLLEGEDDRVLAK